MKYYIISGETSGDNHASRVIYNLKKLDKKAQFRGMGGDQSKAAGQELLIHQKEMSIMGFIEVIYSLRKITKNLKKVKSDISSWKPDAILLVDYPGFNFKIAKFAHRLGIPVHYYISPKVWAWKEKRIKLIKRYVSQLYSILPFEVEYFAEKDVDVIYVGNPSKETVDEYLDAHPFAKEPKGIALLPGSRTQEIKTSLPLMLEGIKEYNDKPIYVAQAPGFDADFYHQFDPKLRLIKGDVYGLLAKSKVALVTSGTATLETALMNVPQVICYKASFISYLIVRAVLKLEYVSLVNLILGRAAITELLQYNFSAPKVKQELDLLLQNTSRRGKILEDYKLLRDSLGDHKPSKLVARNIFKSLSV